MQTNAAACRTVAETNISNPDRRWMKAKKTGYNGGQSKSRLPSNETSPRPSDRFKPPNSRGTESVEMPNPYFDILNHRTNPHSIWKVINARNLRPSVHFMAKDFITLIGWKMR